MIDLFIYLSATRRLAHEEGFCGLFDKLSSCTRPVRNVSINGTSVEVASENQDSRPYQPLGDYFQGALKVVISFRGL